MINGLGKIKFMNPILIGVTIGIWFLFFLFLIWGYLESSKDGASDYNVGAMILFILALLFSMGLGVQWEEENHNRLNQNPITIEQVK